MYQANVLKGEVGTCTSDNGRLDARCRGECILVWHRRETPAESSVSRRACAKVIARCICKSSISAVESRTACSLPDVVLHKKLRFNTSVDTVVHVQIIVVEDVSSTKAEGWATRVEIRPIVVVNGDGNRLVLRAVAVRVADEHRLPMIMQFAPGYGDIGTAMGDIAEAIIVILIVIAVGREVDVVDPNFRSLLNSDSITRIGKDLFYNEVADDYVGNLDDANANTGESDARSSSQDGCVRSWLDNGGSSEGCCQNDNLLGITSNGCLESGQGRHTSRRSSLTTSRSSERCITNHAAARSRRSRARRGRSR